MILRAKNKTFNGSTSKDILIGDAFRIFSGSIISQNKGKIKRGHHTQLGFGSKIFASNKMLSALDDAEIAFSDK